MSISVHAESAAIPSTADEHVASVPARITSEARGTTGHAFAREHQRKHHGDLCANRHLHAGSLRDEKRKPTR